MAMVALAGMALVAGDAPAAGDVLGGAPELVPGWEKDLAPKQAQRLGESGGKAQAKDSMKEVVPASKMHAGVKQQVVEEEKREPPTPRAWCR